MANFCYQCTEKLFGKEDAINNDFSGIVRKRERYYCLCEGCGWITVDGDGMIVEEDEK
jgi:hypothetical protein